MNEMAQSVKNLITKYTIWQKSLKPTSGASTIHVDEVASRVASFYEKIRTVIDWKEEHLMRRTAIIRKLKRRFLDLELNNFTTQGIAESLVMEFIRGGYFPNDKIEESKVKNVQGIIDKYVFILKQQNPAASPVGEASLAPSSGRESKKGKSGLQFHARLLEIASCEIEETLAPSIKEMALIEFMISQMKERIKVHEDIYKKGLLKKEETDIQIYIAVQESLFKLDDPIISYNLIRYKYPWWDNPSAENLTEASQNIHDMLKTIEQELVHPLGKKFYAICEKYDTPYLLLGDILVNLNPEEMTTQVFDPVALEANLREVYGARLTLLKEKIQRAAVYSTASIFITKILALVILEWLLALMLGHSFDAAFLAADILIPTALMAMLVVTVRPPSKKNLSLVIMETMKIVFPKETKEVYDIKRSRKRGLTTRAILALIYLIGACISFGFIFFVFWYLGFPLFSIIINILFIALILFAGMAVRTRSRELSIEDEKEGVLGFISDILFLPMAGTGRWLSNTWKQYNAITAFLNALIDMPFAGFVEFIERWRYFIKDKKEDLR